jgi:hypothetical protein
MTEQFAMDYIPLRMKQLGYRNYHVRYREIGVYGQTSLTIEAYNALYFIIEVPPEMIVESDYGFYFTTSDVDWTENIHEHRGEIIITNQNERNERVKLIQVTLIN